MIDHARRFGGVARLYGAQGAAQIFSSHVVVVGVGGVGSWSAEALARSGVGHITLIDMDHVAESNINRQIHSLDSTLGKSKIEAMQDRILAINPICQIRLIDEFVTPDNWSSFVSHVAKDATINGLIDACDQVSAKTTLAAWALQQENLNFVTVGAAGGKQGAELVQISDLAQTTHDPLLAKLRYNLRRNYGAQRQGQMGVTCIFSQEAVQAPQQIGCELPNATDSTLNCHGFGSSVAVTATFGMCAAGEIIKQLAKSSKRAL